MTLERIRKKQAGQCNSGGQLREPLFQECKKDHGQPSHSDPEEQQDCYRAGKIVSCNQMIRQEQQNDWCDAVVGVIVMVIIDVISEDISVTGFSGIFVIWIFPVHSARQTALLADEPACFQRHLPVPASSGFPLSAEIHVTSQYRQACIPWRRIR